MAEWGSALRDAAELIVLSTLRALASVLPFRAASAVGEALGEVVFQCSPGRRAIALDNLRQALPEQDELRPMARRSFRNYGRALTEMLWAASASAESLRAVMRPRNLDVAAAALARGRGLILLTAHFGSWELLSHLPGLYLGMPMTIVVQPQRNRRVGRLFDRMRGRFDNATVPSSGSTRALLQTLQDGGIVCMLGDQCGPPQSLVVDFFGRPALTHRGAAWLSLKTGAPIVLFLPYRQPDGHWAVVFEEVDRTALDGPSAENVAELTRRHVCALERGIRLRPDHWLWMHRRWKDRSRT